MNLSRFRRRPGVSTGRRRTITTAVTAAVAIALAGCSSAAAANDGAGNGEGGTSGGGAVTLITHDSFAVDEDVLSAFESRTGIDVQILAQGDTGAMLSKVILTKDNPLGDAVFGIDNTFATKAMSSGVLEPYASPVAGEGSADHAIGSGHLLTAIDYGDVCVNVDHKYFAEHDLAEPVTFEDLASPAYRDLLVVEDAATSSPGLAFLLGTIAHFGVDGWQDYWTALKANGVKVDAGWTEAYTVDFSGSSGNGTRPLVVSYASSPPAEVTAGMNHAPTGALLETCFRQVEYAGVLAGAANPDGARQVIDFLLSDAFQSQIPAHMYMYPVDESVALPDSWASYAPTASDPAGLDPAQIEQGRQQWITEWSNLMAG